MFLANLFKKSQKVSLDQNNYNVICEFERLFHIAIFNVSVSYLRKSKKNFLTKY